MRKMLIVMSGFLLALLSWFLLRTPNILFESSFDQSIPQVKEYSLTNNYVPFDQTPARALPTVQTKPDNTNKYKVILFKEYIDSFWTYDELFFASKRIAELQTWGNELDWKKTLDKYKDHINAYKWQVNEKEYISTLQAHYHLLEDLIFIQSNDLEKNIQKIQYVDKIFSQLYQPTSNSYSLTNIVKDKEYGVYNISTQINSDLSSLKNIRLSLKNTDYFPKISDSDDPDIKEITFNNILIDRSNYLSGEILIKLPEIRYKVFKWIKTIDKIAPNPYSYKALISDLAPGDYRINIDSSLKNPFFVSIEERVASSESKLRYRVDPVYQQTIYPHGYSHTFSRPLQKSASSKATVKILGTYLNIESVKELSTNELNSISISFTPKVQLDSLTATKVAGLSDNKPVIYSKKISDIQYEITTVNLSKNQDKKILESLGFDWGWRVVNELHNERQSEYTIVYWLKYAIGSIILFGIILYFLLRLLWLFKYLWRFFQYICTKIRVVLLLLVLSGLFIDFSIIQGSRDIIILLLTSLWILALIGYNVEARINFVFALLFLLFCPILIILKLDLLAEKSAIWAYMMLTIGTVQSIIEMKLETKDLTEYSVFLNKITGYLIIRSLILKFTKFVVKGLLSLINFVKKLVINFVSLIIKKIVSVFSYSFKLLRKIVNKRPRTVKDFSVIILKIFAIVSFLIVFIIFIFSIPIIIGFTTTKITIALNDYAIYYQKQLKIENLKKERKKLDPYVKIVEPKLAYKATNVVIYGENFGWDPKNAQAMIDGKTIVPVLWQDSMIIFPVPLDWKDGIHKISVQKKIEWEGKKTVGKSQIFEIKLLPIGANFTKDDDLYFEQMKTWRPETRKLNGYN